MPGTLSDLLKEVVDIAETSYTALNADSRQKLEEFLTQIDKVVQAQLLKNYKFTAKLLRLQSMSGVNMPNLLGMVE